jgi:hypothetical protein
MAAMLQREEWKAFSDFMALVAAGLCALVGLVLGVVERKEPKAEAGTANAARLAGRGGP